MAAIYTLIRMAGTIVPGKPHAQIGFPYVDTWKDLECFTEAPLMQTGVTNAGIDRFFRESSNRGFGLVLCECPSNPLLESPDPRLLREHASAAGAILAIDDTVASSINIEALPFADVVTTSLSKWFNGRGDILAGALVLNRNSPHHARMREFLGTEYQPELSHRDMEVLLKNSAGYRTRVRKAGFNAMKLAEMLRAHPRIDRVYTAAVDDSPAYASIARPGSTMPGLLSFTFRDETEHPMKFYDALSVCKGPSLGTDWTLACPYTLLAHYSELDWVRSCGVSPNLLRVSLGVEDTDDLLERFDRALTA
jgi:cystathionine gamma-synthase